jgi:hypothetical protein
MSGERGGQGIWPSLPSHITRAFLHSHHFTNNWLRNVKMTAYAICWRPKKTFQRFTVICRKPHVASSICLRATIFQNPEGTLWTHCIKKMYGLNNIKSVFFSSLFNLSFITISNNVNLLQNLSRGSFTMLKWWNVAVLSGGCWSVQAAVYNALFKQQCTMLCSSSSVRCSV